MPRRKKGTEEGGKKKQSRSRPGLKPVPRQIQAGASLTVLSAADAAVQLERAAARLRRSPDFESLKNRKVGEFWDAS